MPMVDDLKAAEKPADQSAPAASAAPMPAAAPAPAPSAGAAAPASETTRGRSAQAMSDREYPDRPIVGIGIVVIKDNQVLLCRRGKPPNVGSWTLPGGAQELGETCEAAARRELPRKPG